MLPKLLVLSFAATAYALIRLPCSQLVTERFDPLVTPGEVSPHLHQIVGGNAFDIDMNPANGDIAEKATCTTCRFKEDKSNYWTAVMYYKHQNGSYLRVPQMANHNTGPGLQAGGMTIYYFQPGTTNFTVFTKGFRMRVGAPNNRRDVYPPSSPEAHATTFRCFDGNNIGNSAPGYGDDTYAFPNRTCSGGIRSNIYFPSCWDGVNLDSPDHESHMAHPRGGFFANDCPSSHPIRTPILFLEIVWDTRPFNGELWPRDGSQPFVLSNGDPTGFGQHADYVFGWEGDSLQRAMDVCTGGDGIPTHCSALTVIDIESMNNCRLPVKVPEITEDQYIAELPGCNPLQGGPDPARPIPNCDAPSTTTEAPTPTGAPAVVNPPWTVCNSGATSEYLVPNCDSVPTTAPRADGIGAREAVVTAVA